MLTVRLTVAAFALLFAGAAQAAPVAIVADDASSLVIKVVDDATSETDAIELDEGKVPSPEGQPANPPAASAPSSGDNLESDEMKREGMKD